MLVFFFACIHVQLVYQSCHTVPVSLYESELTVTVLLFTNEGSVLMYCCLYFDGTLQ